MRIEELRDPICDLRFLLNRGYQKGTAITVVANKYKLDVRERNFLVRTVFSDSEAEEHKKKLVHLREIEGEKVIVDGYNVLICVESALKGGEIILCDDGFVRDISATFGKYKVSEFTLPAILEIAKLLKENSAESVLFIFDSQVSYSGELCKLVRGKMEKLGLGGEAKTSANVDYVITKDKGIVCSSDRAIIKKVSKVVDIPYYVAAKLKVIRKMPTCEGLQQ